MLRLFRQKRRRLSLDEQDFQDEISAHLAMAAKERMDEGADERSARLASIKEFGNLTLTAEAARRVWRPHWLEAARDVLDDVRYAVRSLRKNPVFAVTVIGVLTLGIGLNAAVFTLLKSLSLNPLSGVDGSAGMAVISGETGTGRTLRVSYPDYRHLRDHQTAFSDLMATGYIRVTLGRGRGALPIFAELVSGNYFQVLRVRAQVGRTLLPSDETSAGRNPVAVLSDALWRRNFGADPAVVGRTIEVNHYPFTVVGVADRAFHGTIVSYDVELFMPVTMAEQLEVRPAAAAAAASSVLSDRLAGLLFPHAFLKPGMTMAAAAAQIDALWQELSRDRPVEDAARRLRVVRFWRSPSGAQTYILPLLGLLSAMGLLVLMVACTNIAGLALVRTLSRQGELAVRLALGAGRARIVRLLVVEHLVLALPGAMLGVLLASYGVPLLAAEAQRMAAPERVYFNMGVDGFVLGFAVLAAGFCALVFGLAPALRGTRIDLVTVINEDSAARGAARGRMRGTLVVAQVAVSLVLLVGWGLVTRSQEAAQRAWPGFDASHVSAVDVDLTYNAYDPKRGRVFYRRLLDEMRAAPGVESATLAAYMPLAFLDTPPRRVEVDGYVRRRDEDLAFMANTVGPDYFRTLRIPLRAGREFEDRDGEPAAPAVIVNETFARRFWERPENAIGKRVRVAEGAWRTVIGVAADVKYSRIEEGPRPYVYLPFMQSYRPDMVLHTRGPAPAEELVEQARARFAALDPELPVLAARPLANQKRGALIFFNLAAFFLFLFGAAGTGLVGMGVYGMVAYSVRGSTREIGIRMALGASGAAAVRAVLARGLRLACAGAALGIVAACAAAQIARGVLFGVSPVDAYAFTKALAIVLGGVAVASIVPAWRAARTSPLAALRHQ